MGSLSSHTVGCLPNRGRSRLTPPWATPFPILLLVMMLPVAAQASPASSRPIELVFVPQETSGSTRPTLRNGITERPVRLEVTDKRDVSDPLVVGAQLDDDVQKFAWRASQAPLPKITGFAQQILQKWMIQLSPEADLVLSLQLTRYYVTETKQVVGSTYLAEVGLRGSLSDQGKTVWEGTASGETRRYGRDHSADNSNEVLSDALTDALSKLLSQDSLQSAWAPSPEGSPGSPSAVTPAMLLEELLKLKASGMGDDTLVAFVKKQKLSAPLSADEMIAWKAKGIPEAAIQAALALP